MSQKTPRRTRRRTADEENTPFKAPTPKPVEEVVQNAEEIEATTTPTTPEDVEVANGTETHDDDNGVVTRSRSTTPQVKKLANGHDDVKTDDVEVTEKEEMDPLVITDEPDPELVFEESSDVESGRSSPATRCKTRRCESRNIPTPKTPNVVERQEEEEDDDEVEHEDLLELDVTFESCSENASTKVEVGGDSTRLEYMESSNLEDNSFLQGAKNKSFGEAMRQLSTRRTIRPISEDYRKKILLSNANKNAASSAYPTRSSIERLSVGIKRKSDSEEEECRKRFKGESPGFFARLTSPLVSIRNTFRSDLASSTPKLTGYKDEKFLIEDDDDAKLYQVDGERRWCSIM